MLAACFVAAFVAFPMPDKFPNHYWLFHSVGHTLLAAGYYILYMLIEHEVNTIYKPHLAKHNTTAAAAAAKQSHASGCNISRNRQPAGAEPVRVQTWRSRIAQKVVIASLRMHCITW